MHRRSDDGFLQEITTDQTCSQDELVWKISWLRAFSWIAFSFLDHPVVEDDTKPISSSRQKMLYPMDELNPSQVLSHDRSNRAQMSLLLLFWTVAWNVTFPTWMRKTMTTLSSPPKSCAIDLGHYDDKEHNNTTAQSRKLLHSNAPDRTRPKSHEVTSDSDNHEPAWTDSIGYGEIEPRTIWQIIDWVFLFSRDDSHKNSWELRCVVDLGSGSGVALLAAAWRWLLHQQIAASSGNSSSGSQPSQLALLGMELNPYWQSIAEANAQDLLFGLSNVLQLSSQLSLDCSFVTADFTKNTSWTTQADLVLVHATVFQDELMDALSIICAQCCPGTYFAMVSRPLQDPNIVTIRKTEMEMSWGLSTVYLQRRIAFEKDDLE